MSADEVDWRRRCFEWALKSARAGDVVVHAEVAPAGREPFWHAWIERRGRALDNEGNDVDAATFRQAMGVRKEDRYPDYEALVYAFKTSHFGPWELEERGQPPPAPRGPRPRRRPRRVGGAS